MKEYLLPLFETEDRNLVHLKSKYKGTNSSMASLESLPSKHLKTVYDELKLSELLSNELSKFPNLA